VRKVMVVVAVGPQHHELLAHEERRRTVTELLGHLRQRQADRPHSILD
jgi:hypothetical protein